MNRRLPFLLATLVVSLASAEDAPRQLTLPEAIQLALQNNPDLATAQQRVAAARAGILQAESALWPRLRVSESYAASDTPVQAFMMTLNQRAFSFGADFNRPGTTDNLNTKVLAHWSLYDGGQSLASRQAARLNTEAASQSLEAVRNDLVFEVTRAYHTIGKARQFVSVTEASVSNMTATVNVSSNRVAAGQALKTDLLDAEVRLAENRENFVRARHAEALSELVFRNVLGVSEKETVTASPHPVTLSEAKSLTTDGRMRPELLAAENAVAAAERKVRVAQAGHWPRVNTFASYDLDSGDTRRFEDSWVAGVSVELDVFDGFLTRGKVAEARANLETARHQARKMALAIALEIRQAQLSLEDAFARLETTGKTVAQAEESLQITKDRYANGLALIPQLLDAETALTAARHRRAAAETDVLIAHAALARALGVPTKE